MRAAIRLSLALAVILSGLAPLAPRARLAAQPSAEDWDRHEVRIPVRDGITLYAVVVAPKERDKPLPIMLVRTPYGVENNLRAGPIGVAYQELAKDGYIFVFEDSRGTNKSEGTFVMNGQGLNKIEIQAWNGANWVTQVGPTGMTNANSWTLNPSLPVVVGNTYRFRGSCPFYAHGGAA